MFTLATKISDITVEEILQFGFPVLIGMFVIALIFYCVAKHKRDVEDDARPVLQATATVVDKQQIAPNTIAFEVWVMFETESGDRVRLVCKPDHNFIVGDKGYLKWQGSRLFSFERGKSAPPNRTSVGYSSRTVATPQGSIPTWKRIQMEEEQKKMENCDNSAGE